MSSIGTGYDLSASQFSPDGRVFQVEYALKAVENSGTVVGIRGKDGVVFAVEKLVTSKLYEDASNKRMFTVDKHIGVATAGLLADCNAVVESMREEATNYRNFFGNPVPLQYLCDRVALYVHAHTLYSSVRPFGVSSILGAYENGKPVMFSIEPSGVCLGYLGCSIGKAKHAAKTELEKLKMKDAPIKDLVKEAAKIIHIVHDEAKDKEFQLELSWVGEVTGGKHELVPKDIALLAETYAKEQMQSDDSDDDETEPARS